MGQYQSEVTMAHSYKPQITKFWKETANLIETTKQQFNSQHQSFKDMCEKMRRIIDSSEESIYELMKSSFEAKLSQLEFNQNGANTLKTKLEDVFQKENQLPTVRFLQQISERRSILQQTESLLTEHLKTSQNSSAEKNYQEMFTEAVDKKMKALLRDCCSSAAIVTPKQAVSERSMSRLKLDKTVREQTPLNVLMREDRETNLLSSRHKSTKSITRSRSPVFKTDMRTSVF